MGKLIVIEGLDGSGKATQTSLLANTLKNQGEQAIQISFPNYQSPSSSLVKMYLAGEFGSRPTDVNAYAASSFYAVDRYAGWKTGWQEFYQQGGIILADRYTTSNMIHQCAKLPQEEKEQYLTWLQDFEYNKLGLPAPDLVLYLDVEPAISQELMSKRYENDESKKDIHEKDIEYLNTCRASALWCGEKLGWLRIHCTENGAMKSQQSIAEQVLQAVKEQL